jgi:hypothetical protein
MLFLKTSQKLGWVTLCSLAFMCTATIGEADPKCSCSSESSSGSSPDFFSEYVSSAIYVSNARESLLPDHQFRLLLSRFDRAVPPAPEREIISILDGTFAELPESNVEHESAGDPTPQVEGQSNPTVWSIPTSDYIVTNAFPDLRQVLEDVGVAAAEEVDVYGELGHRVNGALFKIYTETENLSDCSLLVCRAWREVLKQTSIRTSISFAERSWTSASQLEIELRPILFALVSSQTMKDEMKVAFAPLIVAVAPLVIQGGVSLICCCIKYWSATTTTPEPTTTEQPTTVNKYGELRSSYFLIANADLDEVRQLLATVKIEGQEEPTVVKTISSVRQRIADKMVNITTVISKISSLAKSIFDPSKCTRLAFGIIQDLNSATSPSQWYLVLSKVHEALSDIRSELLNFAVASQL